MRREEKEVEGKDLILVWRWQEEVSPGVTALGL